MKDLGFRDNTCSERQTLHRMASQEPFLVRSLGLFWLLPALLPTKQNDYLLKIVQVELGTEFILSQILGSASVL